jgi:hypothetical protein
MPFQTLTNPPVEPLTEAEKQIILDWVKAGAPKGTCDTADAPAASASAPAPRRKAAGKPAAVKPKAAPPAASSKHTGDRSNGS